MVFASQSCHFTRVGDGYDVGLKITTLVVGEKMPLPFQTDSRLDPACAVVVKPDTDLLSLELLLLSHVAHRYQHAPRLQHPKCQLTGSWLNVV